MKIIIPGGAGQLGHLLCKAFHQEGDEVVVLSRQPGTAQGEPWRTVGWDARTKGDWCRELEGADAVINLAGRSVNCRYTAKNRQAILDSRVVSTQAIGMAIANAKRPPRVWLQSSTATLYAHRYDAANDEPHGIIGGTEGDAPETWRFSIEVATAWERAAEAFLPLPQTRCVLMRSAIVMSRIAWSPLAILSFLARCGLGGAAGDGRQYVSWIHEDDFVAAVKWLIERETLSGAVNLAAPHPLPNRDFVREIRTAWGVPFGLPACAWMLEIAAFFYRTETELLLKSRRVVPTRLLEDGFQFRFPKWDGAIRDLVRRWSNG